TLDSPTIVAVVDNVDARTLREGVLLPREPTATTRKQYSVPSVSPSTGADARSAATVGPIRQVAPPSCDHSTSYCISPKTSSQLTTTRLEDAGAARTPVGRAGTLGIVTVTTLDGSDSMIDVTAK